MTLEEQVDVVRMYTDRLTGDDHRGALALLHDDVRVLVPDELPYGGTWTGHDGVEQLWSTVRATWQQWHEPPEFDELAVAGRRVYREVLVRAVATATGRPVELYFTDVFEFRDGKIAEIRSYCADPSVVAAACRVE